MIEISDDKERLDRSRVYEFLAGTYWANKRTQETIDKSIDGALCFSAWIDGTMVGFARVVTDKATFAWLCDVVVAPDLRSQGIGKAIVTYIMSYPGLETVRWMLGTRDAHELYTQFGFKTETEVDRWMTKGFGNRFCIVE